MGATTLALRGSIETLWHPLGPAPPRPINLHAGHCIPPVQLHAWAGRRPGMLSAWPAWDIVAFMWGADLRPGQWRTWVRLPIVTSCSLGSMRGVLIGTKHAPEKSGGMSCNYSSVPVADEAINRWGSCIAHEINSMWGCIVFRQEGKGDPGVPTQWGSTARALRPLGRRLTRASPYHPSEQT